MAEVSPQRHNMRSYDDEWLHEPLARVSHLSNGSITFALNLRPLKRLSSHSPKKSFKQAAIAEKMPSSKCFEKTCRQKYAAVKELTHLNSELKRKLDCREQELNVAEKEKMVADCKLSKLLETHNELRTTLYDLKILERKKNLPEKLDKTRKENQDLRRELNNRRILLLQLHRDQDRQVLPQAKLFPDFDMNQTLTPQSTIIIHREEENQSDSKPAIYQHSGVYIRSAKTNWEPCWTCCMSSDRNAGGCNKISNTMSLKYYNFMKSKSENSIQTADLWDKSRKESLRPKTANGQWSSRTSTPGRGRLTEQASRFSKTYSKLSVVEPIF